MKPPKKAKPPRSKLPNGTASVKAETLGLVQASHEANSADVSDSTMNVIHVTVNDQAIALGMAQSSDKTHPREFTSQPSPDGSQPGTEQNSELGQASESEMQEGVTNVTKQESITSVAKPLSDIRTSWMRVAWQALVALSCMIPGASLLVIPIMCWLCGCKKTHMLGERGAASREVLMWLTLAWNAITDVLFLVACGLASEEGINLRPIVEQIQLRQISDILTLGSVLLWRVLSIHIIEVSVEVHKHKEAALKKLNSKMEKIVDELRWSVKGEHIPRNFDQVNSMRGKILRSPLELCLSAGSAIVLTVGMLFLQLRVDRGNANSEKLRLAMVRIFSFGLSGSLSINSPISQTDIPWTRVVSSVCISALGGYSWFRAIAGILASTRLIRTNRDQLLLFLYESSDRNNEYVSDSERRSLGGGQGLSEDRHVFAPLVLRKATKAEDVKAWWELRRFIQVDFTDESAIMDACGFVVIVLILGLLFCGKWNGHFMESFFHLHSC